VPPSTGRWSVSGSYRYSVKEVKDALQAGVLIEEFDHFHEVVYDLIEGLQVLVKRTPQYVDSILERYVSFNVPERGASQVRLSNALEVLTNEMNKSHRRRFAMRDDGPGTRNVLSNRAAQVGTIVDYQGILNEGRN
jgi:hypothetical protein